LYIKTGITGLDFAAARNRLYGLMAECLIGEDEINISITSGNNYICQIIVEIQQY
jgi:hypothetical protein